MPPRGSTPKAASRNLHTRTRMEAVVSNLIVDVGPIKRVEGFVTPAEILSGGALPLDPLEQWRAEVAARNSATVFRRRRRPKTGRRNGGDRA
jgi:hypothetical protein